MPTPRRFSWVHLSDVHVGLTEQTYLGPNVEVLVHDDLARLHDKSGPWHAIFFTGDLTQRGNKGEFKRFDELLERLLAKIRELGSEPVFLAVPGNHDLVRPDPYSGTVSLAKTWSTDPDLRDHFFSNAKGDLRTGVGTAFANWLKWWGHRNPRSLPGYLAGDVPGDFRVTLDVSGVRIGIVGLNSAFLHLRGGDLKGKLGLDQRQFARLVPEGGLAWSRDHDATFLLTHHSPDWLDEPGQLTLRNDIAPPSVFTLHLFGHEHEGGAVFISEGGAQPRYRVMARSLFGLPEWGEEKKQQKRLFGYSVGELRFEERNRLLRLWPRKGEILQSGGWQMAPDYSSQLKDDQGTEPVALGPSPRSPSPPPPGAASHPVDAKPAAVITASFLKGWEVLDERGLTARRQDLKPEALRRYFDGEVPAWAHALSPKIPRRKVVQQVVTDLQKCMESGVWRIALLVGAGGEGKSTALRQAAVDVATGLPGWKLLWRPEPDIALDAEAVCKLPPGPWLLVSDDADHLVSSLSKVLNAIRLTERSDIHFLLATRDTDWVHAGGEALPWGEVIKRYRMAGIEEQDARDVVRAWEEAGPDALGALQELKDEPERIRALMDAAQRRDDRRERGSFFGAILKVRFSPEGLRAHVLTLMSRLSERKLSSGKTLRDAFIAIAALDAVGINGIDRSVLADLLVVKAERFRPDVLRPLGEEAAAVEAGTMVRTRHVDIAHAALAVAEQSGEQDLAEVYAQIVKQTAVTALTLQLGDKHGRFHGQVLNMGLTLFDELPKDFSIVRRTEIAIRAAQASVEAQPDRLTSVTTLARTWRAAHKPLKAIQTLQAAAGNLGNKIDYDETIRGFWFEWSVCAGELKMQASAAFLAGLSVSDEFRPVPVELERAKFSLAGLGVGFGELTGGPGRDVYARGLRAVSVLGLLTNPDPKTRDYFDRYSRKADELNVEKPDFATSILWFRDAIRTALKQAQTSGELTFKSDALSFEMLEERLAERLPGRPREEQKLRYSSTETSTRNKRKPKR